MRVQARLAENVDLLLTEDLHGYEDVLRDAEENGGELFLVAYAITLKGDRMLKLLQTGVPNVQRIEFITGIPSFHRRDWSPKWSVPAKKEIEAYFAVLDPSQLHESVSVAIVTNSHAKIAVSDRVAYVGSANFSDASAQKKEAGVVVRSPALAQEIRRSFKATFADDIYRYNPSALSLVSALQALSEARPALASVEAKLREYTDEDTGELGVGPQHVDDIQSWAARTADALASVAEMLSADALEDAGLETPDLLLPERIGPVVEALTHPDVEEFTAFSRADFVERRVQELTAADPEGLDAASEAANDEAEEEISDRFEKAWGHIKPVLAQVSEFHEAIKSVSVEIRNDLRALRYLVVGN